MAKLTLRIVGNTDDVKAKIAQINNELAQIGKTPIRISVDSQGLDAVDKTAVKLVQAQARIAEANARITVSENNLKIAREKSSQETEKRVSAEAKLATQMEKTATAEEQARRANTNLQTQVEKTATEEAKLATQTEKTNTEFAKAATQAEKTATEEAKLAVQTEKTATATAKAGESLQSAAQNTQDAARQNGLLGDSLDRIFAKVSAWQVINMIVSSAIGSVREALSVMQEVDSELVTVRKVTGFTADEMARVEEQAYKTASAYGVSANEYLESVAAFARAGYKEQSEALAELSTKTQIVGDTNAEVANQFLLSVDAAYKYQGSIEDLSRVLDGANELDNNYATSIEKIAEGMGIVAPVAAQMHVTVDELAASIGTITAVTQRSGSEAARALRALFLNIAGDTKTEIDEGVTWTTGEIEGLRDVIKLYAKDAWDAAQASEGIIDPMKAMEGLAKSMQDGVLSEQKLIEMVSDIGGKLRTSQLLAIIQNWGMYSDMLDSFSDSVGSADKEVANALDSWERKTNILKNSWTELVSNIVETDAIKTGLDLLTGAIDAFDTALGRTIISVGVLGGALYALAATHPIIAAIAAGIAATVAVVGAVNNAIDAHKAYQQETADRFSGVTAIKDAKNLGELTNAVAEAEEKLAAAEVDRAAAQEEYNRLSAQYVTDSDKLLSMTKEQIEANDEIARSMGEAQSAIEYADNTVAQYTAALDEARAALDDYTESSSENREMTMDEWNAMLDAEYEFQQAQKETAEAAAESNRQMVSSMVDDLLTLEDELADAKTAIEAFGEATGSEKGDTFSAYAGIYEQFLEDWEKGLKGSNTVKAAIEAILGPETILAYAGDWEALGEMLASDFWRGVFSEGGEDYGANFMNAIADIADEYGRVIDENGDVVASFEEVGDALVLTSFDAEGLADMLGTTPDVLMSVLDAWDIYSAKLTYTRDEMMNLIEAAGALNSDGSVDLTAFLTSLAEDGERTQSEILDIYNALMDLDNVQITNVPEDIAEIISKAETASDKMREAQEETKNLDSESAEPKITADTTEFDRAVSEIERTLDRLSKTPTVITITEQTTKASAGGTDYAEGGATLVNEEGPEIIQEGDTARIAGGGQPTITNVQRGARIFTAEETRRILGDQSAMSFFHAAAMGRGGRFSDAGTGTPLTAQSVGNPAGPSTRQRNFYGSSYGTAAANAASAAVTTAIAATAAADATSAIEDAQKEIEERYKTELELLKSQLDLMERQGASTEDRAAKISEIQNLLHQEADELRGIGASETDINKLSSEWWKYREDRIEAYQDAFEDEIKLKESELDLMEKQGKSEDERAAKISEIQSLLHLEAEFLRSVGAEQEKINKLSSEWLDLQKEKIELLTIETEKRAQIVTLRESELSFLEASDADLYQQISKMRSIQDALHDEAEAVRATAAYQEAIRQQQEDETKLTEDQVKLLTRVTGLSSEWWEYQAKIDKALEEADDTLDRIVARYEELEDQYTAMLDQAEDARVSALQEELDLLKAQKDEIDDAREEEEKLLAVEKARIALENAQNERNVRQYNAATGQWEWVANAQNVAKARDDLAKAEQALDDFYRDRSIKALEENIKTIQSSYDDLRDAIGEFVKGIKDGTLDFTNAMSFFTSRFAGTGLEALAGLIGGGFANAGSETVLDKMKANSAAWWGADEKTRQDLANENMRLGTAQGWHRGDDGYWYKADGSRAYDLYDSGGILRGVGGIKATRGDEMILPPGMTSKLLNAEKDGAFDALMGHLGIVTAAGQSLAGFSGSITSSRIGTQNNGDSYHIGGVTISESQARGMTVYDLAQYARTLSLHNA